MLTPRQEQLLGKVVDGFNATGQPVGSKALAADADVQAGASTVRNELAVLEEQSERGGLQFYVFRSESKNQRGELVCEGRWTNIVR